MFERTTDSRESAGWADLCAGFGRLQLAASRHGKSEQLWALQGKPDTTLAEWQGLAAELNALDKSANDFDGRDGKRRAVGVTVSIVTETFTCPGGRCSRRALRTAIGNLPECGLLRTKMVAER